MHERHWSSCKLNNGPATRPQWCSCGGYGKTTFLSNLWDWLVQNARYFTGRL